MHDPSHLLLDVRWLNLDVWHDEPGGMDAFTVCGHAPSGFARVRWAARHWRHLHCRWWPYQRVKRWIVHRCAGCGRRFLWKDGRHSYQGTDMVWHSPCMTLRHVQGMLDDATQYIQNQADWDTRWRVEYRLKRLGSTGEQADD